MSFREVKILCQCFEFDHELPFSKRSIFNETTNRWEVGSVVNLHEYAVDIGTLSFTGMRIDVENGYNTLVNEAGDITLKLSGIKNNEFLAGYFNLFDLSGVNAYRQYIVLLKYNNQVTFIGTVNPDNISELYNTGKDSEIIQVQVIGIEKEFKRYFGALSLPDHQAVFAYNGIDMPWAHSPYNDEDGGNYAKCITIYDLFHVIFNVITNLEIAAPDWYINNIPQMFIHDSYPSIQWYMKSGYKRFYQENKLSCFDLLEKICNAMGWQWNITNNGDSFENFKLFIKNRSDFSLSTREIDYEDIIEYKIGYQINRTDIDYIVIPDGYYFNTGLYGKQGKPFYMVTNKLNPINETKFFEGFAISGDHYTLWPWNNLARYCVENAEAKDSFSYGEIRYYDTTNWGHTSREDKFIKSNHILYIDAGSHDSQSTVCCPATRHNRNDTKVGEDQTDILFRGSCGSMLFQFDGSYILQQDYNSYSKTEQFRNNFLPILNGGNNQTVELQIKGVISDPLVTIKFINSNKQFFQNSLFAITELQVDYINERSKLLLIRKS